MPDRAGNGQHLPKLLSTIHRNSPNEATQQEGKIFGRADFLRKSPKSYSLIWISCIEAAELSHSTITVRAEDFLLYYLARRF